MFKGQWLILFVHISLMAPSVGTIKILTVYLEGCAYHLYLELRAQQNYGVRSSIERIEGFHKNFTSMHMIQKNVKMYKHTRISDFLPSFLKPWLPDLC